MTRTGGILALSDRKDVNMLRLVWVTYKVLPLQPGSMASPECVIIA